jgi:predicted MFS family arabinose efflux permease
MNGRIAILAAASFAMGTEAYVYAGHLAAMAENLGTSVASAGQAATVFALTYAVTAPLVAGAAARHGRRTVIVAGLILIGTLNLGAAFTSSLGALLGIRFLCGLAAGLVGPIAAVAAAELAPPDQRGKAMAIVLGGMTLAFVLGIPMGSIIGDVAGWRGTFAYAGLVALAAALAIRLVLPAMAGGARADASHFRLALDPAVRTYLLLTVVGFSATFATIAYVGPVVTRVAGLSGSGIGAMQALIGVGSIVGIVIGGRMADRPSAGHVLAGSFLVSAAALSLYSLLMLVSDGTARAIVLVALSLGMILGAAALFMRAPIIQARLLAGIPPEARPVILALNGSMVFLGQALGAVIGGLAIAGFGLEAVGFAAGLVALLGAGLALSAVRTPSAAAATVQATS